MSPLSNPSRWQRFHFDPSRRIPIVAMLFALSVEIGSASVGGQRAGAATVANAAKPTTRQVVKTTRQVVKTKRQAVRKAPTNRVTTTRTATSTVPPSTSPGTSNPMTSGPANQPLTPTTVAPQVSVVLPTPAKYLEDALAFIERHWVRRRAVDVKAITDRARAAGSTAQSVAEVHPVLRQAVRDLGDGHSAFLDPVAARALLDGTGTGFGLKVYPPDVIFVVPGSPAEAAGIRTLDRIVSFNAKAFNATTAADRAVETALIRISRPGVGELEFTVRRGELKTAELPTARALDARLGYLELPGSTGTAENERSFAEAGTRAVATVEQQISPCGWVLDLRRNSGGFPFSMMSVLEPFLPEQTVGGFVYGDDRREALRFSGGRVLIDSRVMWSSTNSPRLRDASVPVAVLTSSITGSAGEIATIAFIGRPSSRSFGVQTVGVTSANVGIRLADESFLMVTHSYDLDRFGKVYDGPLIPDEVVNVDWSLFGTAQDPTLAAASVWLGSQPSCATR